MTSVYREETSNDSEINVRFASDSPVQIKKYSKSSTLFAIYQVTIKSVK